MFIVRICFGKALFSLMEKTKQNKTKKTAISFHQSMQVCIKQIMACKPLSAVVCSKYRLRSNGRKVVKQITSSYTQGFSFGKYRLY